MRRIILMLGLALLLGACDEQIDVPTAPDEAPAMVSATAQDLPFNTVLPDPAWTPDALAALASAATISCTPASVPTAGLVSPPFGPAVHIFTNEYDVCGVHFSAGPPGPNAPTAVFSDPPLAWGGVNPAGDVDLLSPTDGMIVVPGTGGLAGQTTMLTVEAGYVGSDDDLLLEAFDCRGNLVASTIADDGIGPNGRRLMSLSAGAGPGIAAFRVLTPTGDTYGVDWIELENPTRCVIEVTIDIKPGSDPNSINCLPEKNQDATISVAILTTDDFDAMTVDHTTVSFEGATETHVDKKTGEPRRHEEDVDGDGDMDLVFHFRYGDTGLTCDSTDGMLVGETYDGTPIEGIDAVRMVGGV